ncbi:hypothetical protein ABK040_015879 [Willaertia magna]
MALQGFIVTNSSGSIGIRAITLNKKLKGIEKERRLEEGFNENICPDAEEEIAIFREMCEDPILLRCVNFALPANLFENQTTPYDDGDNDDKNQCLNHKECISDPNCVYISKGFFTVSSDDNPDYARVLTLNSNGTCWRGFVVVGTPLSEYVHRGDGLVYKIETEETFYSTCQIREVFYWVILGSGILLAIICCCTACVCCMCCFCFQCRNREKYESIN